MTNPKRRHLPALMAVGALGMSGTLAMAAEPTQQELMEQIQQLQQKVSQLEQKETVNAKDVDATIDSVLNDADRRSQLLQMEGFTAGHKDGKFVLQSADGNFVMHPGVQFQFRNVTNYRDGDDSLLDDGEETEHGFEVRRLKFSLEGNAFNPDLKYVFVWASQRSGDEVVVDIGDSPEFELFGGGSLVLEDAYITYRFSDAWYAKAGQFKDPVHHEELTSSKRQLAVDRSLLNERLGGGVTDRVQGVALMYNDGGSFRAEMVLHDGINTDNTNYRDIGGGLDVGGPHFGMAARVEWMAIGDNWKAYDDFTAMGNEDGILVLGAGGDWTQAGDNNDYFHTIDAQWEGSNGLGLYGAYVGIMGDVDETSAFGGEDNPYDWGFLVQAGFMLNDQWELFGRADYIDPDDDRSGASITDDDDDSIELTVGVNYYIMKHAAKVTIDGFWLPDGSDGSESGIGIEDSGDEDQFGIRAQFQLLL